MADNQKDQRFGGNQPGQEKNQGAQNPGMQKDLNTPSSQDRGLNPSGHLDQKRDLEREGQQRSGEADRNQGLNPSGQSTPDRERTSAEDRGLNPTSKAPGREEEKDDKDDDLTEIPAREEERKKATPDIYNKDDDAKKSGPEANPRPGDSDAPTPMDTE